ncbi:MAG: PhoH family protein, partial [Gammaproteobacteria bacterium]|nr:PhoH family protein [Gammaproteobacteria bacterium]
MTPTPGNRIFVLDTNVLIHDPTALFRFEEHDVYLPMTVLEELDATKKGMSEASRNARQASRFIDELIQDVSKDQIDHGLPLPSRLNDSDDERGNGSGRLFFQTRSLPYLLPDDLPGGRPDNAILGNTMALLKEHKDTGVTLVSKDINLRIKASVLGIHAEDYYNDRTLNDVDLLFTGVDKLPDDFWEQHSKDVDSWQEKGRTFYRLSGPRAADWYPNQFLYTPNDKHFEAVTREVKDNSAVVEIIDDYCSEKHNIWGIVARNREQN